MIPTTDNVEQLVAQDNKRDIREKLCYFLEKTNLKPSHIESAIGESAGRRIETWIKTGEDKRELAPRVAQLLGFDTDWPPEPTDNLQAVFDLCAYATKKGRIVACGGRAGYGKSTALALYARTQGAIYYCYDEVSGNKDVLRSLAYLAGAQALSSLRVGELLRSITVLLQRNPRTIIIDQADTLKFQTLEAIRSIHDQTGVGVVLAGLPDRLTRRLSRRNAYEHAEQIQSRVAAKITLPAPSRDDVELICSRFGIRAQTSVDFVFSRAAVGGYRHVRMLCEDAREVAIANGTRSVSYAHVQKAAEYLITTHTGQAIDVKEAV